MTGRTAPPVLVALSGGVDSSVAAALLLERGHEVVGVTMKLWGGPADQGCCSVSDVDDARRVAQQLGIDHHVFNFGDAFERHVVEPYVDAHAAGRTPNPCIECNRHLKFDVLLHRARALGFDLVATGHHARVVVAPDGTRRVARGVDAAKDQSYVLHMLGQDTLAQVVLPVGELTKAEVRALAEQRGLRTASKPDSQDVCFIAAGRGGRATFLGERIPLAPGTVRDRTGAVLGRVPAVELVTVGQRRGVAPGRDGRPRYVVAVDVAAAEVVVGHADELLTDHAVLDEVAWASTPVTGPVEAQLSAHGTPVPAEVEGSASAAVVRFASPQRRVAPGQSVVLYDGDTVLGGGIAV